MMERVRDEPPVIQSHTTDGSARVVFDEQMTNIFPTCILCHLWDSKIVQTSSRVISLEKVTGIFYGLSTC